MPATVFGQLIAAAGSMRARGGRPRGTFYRAKPEGVSTLCDRRLAARLTQVELAERAGVERSTVLRAEAGRAMRPDVAARVWSVIRDAERDVAGLSLL